MTGIANAHVARAPVLVLSGLPPRAQENRGALQDMPHTEFVRPITRYARTVREPVARRCRSSTKRSRAHSATAASRARPTSTSRPIRCARDVPRVVAAAGALHAKPRPRVLPPIRTPSRAAVDLLWSAQAAARHQRPRRARRGAQLVRLLDRLGAPYLDTGESRGLVPETIRRWSRRCAAS